MSNYNYNCYRESQSPIKCKPTSLEEKKKKEKSRSHLQHCSPGDKKRIRKCERSKRFIILNNLQTSPAPVTVSTIPSTPAPADLNPYGTVFIPFDFKFHSGNLLQPGNLLVSNFNNPSNSSGQGRTIVQVSPAGQVTNFYTSPNLYQGFTGLLLFSHGYVIAGNIPTQDGTPNTIGQGAIQFINSRGICVFTLFDSKVSSPWFGTIVEDKSDPNIAFLFVSNVTLGNVVRIPICFDDRGLISIGKISIVSQGFQFQTSTSAIVVGVAGLAYDCECDILYVASEVDNKIYAVQHPFKKRTHFKGRIVYEDSTKLHGALGLVLTPNRHLIISNSDAINPDSSQPSELVEITRSGRFLAQMSVDSALGAAFGIAFNCTPRLGLRFAAVDDATNTVTIWNVLPPPLSI